MDSLSKFPAFPMPATSSRDRNAFYYEPTCPEEPVDAFSLECEQWRHGTREVRFYGEVFVDGKSDEVKGVLVCQIHAENLSEPVKETVSVRGKIIKGSTIERALDLIEESRRR